MTETRFFVLNDHGEAFSNLRDPKPFSEIGLDDIRDFSFDERSRAEEVLEYIRAFESEPIRGVSEGVGREMRRLAREEWHVEPITISWEMSQQTGVDSNRVKKKLA